MSTDTEAVREEKQQQNETKIMKKNANHGNGIKVAIDIAYKARNQELFFKQSVRQS